MISVEVHNSRAEGVKVQCTQYQWKSNKFEDRLCEIKQIAETYLPADNVAGDKWLHNVRLKVGRRFVAIFDATAEAVD